MRVDGTAGRQVKHSQHSRHAHAMCMYAIGESGHQQAVFTRGLPLLAPYSNSSLSEYHPCLSHPPTLVIVRFGIQHHSRSMSPRHWSSSSAGARSDSLSRLASPTTYSHSY